MDNSSGVGVLDKAALVLGALEAGPATPGRARRRPPGSPARPRTGSPWRSSTIGWSPATCRAGSSSARGSRELAAAAGEDRLLAAAGPVLARLRDITGESAQLYRRQGDERVCVAAAERLSGLRDTVPVGAALTMTAGSAAQILLAWEEPDRLHRGLHERALHRDGPVRRTPSRLGAERRRARAGRGLGVGPGARPGRPGRRRGIGLRPDRAAEPPARPAARPDRLRGGGQAQRGPAACTAGQPGQQGQPPQAAQARPPQQASPRAARQPA